MISFQSYHLQGKRVVLRVDFNVPIHKETFKVLDDKRIRAALPTMLHILNSGASLVILSHFGRPKNGYEEANSLKHILPTLESLLKVKVLFSSQCIGPDAEQICSNLKPGDVVLMENVRFHSEETKGDMSFAEKLSLLGNCYVNDAFGAAHRAHASTTQITQFFPQDKMMGFLMEAEMNNAQRIIDHPIKPFVAIVGGAKVSDKLLIIKNLLNIASDIIIGGGMSYTFSKAMGGQVGNSLCENDCLDLVKDILTEAREMGVSIHLPLDSVVAKGFHADAETQISKNDCIPDAWMGLDIGPESVRLFTEVISGSQTILWNGPMGVFEWESFENGTKSIALAVATATKRGAYSLIGGGDSASAIAKFGLQDEVSYVSTGGGALLEMFEGKVLPGIEALA